MLLSRQSIALCSELSQSAADAETSVAWLDYIINIAILGCLVRISEEFVVLFLLLSNECLYVLASFLLAFASLAYSTAAAPDAPITAISADGHA